MELYTIAKTAKKLGMREEGVLALCQAGFFGRKLGNTWAITEQEIEHYDDGMKVPDEDQPVFYDAEAATRLLQIHRSRFYRLVQDQKIEVSYFGGRGGADNIVLTDAQLEAARTVVGDQTGAGSKQVDVDEYIEERDDGRFYILGTLNNDVVDPKERNYKTRTSARARTREAYDQEPLYKRGQEWSYGEAKIVLLKDVTPIDGLVVLRIGGVETLWSLSGLVDYIEGADMKRARKDPITVSHVPVTE